MARAIASICRHDAGLEEVVRAGGLEAVVAQLLKCGDAFTRELLLTCVAAFARHERLHEPLLRAGVSQALRAAATAGFLTPTGKRLVASALGSVMTSEAIASDVLVQLDFDVLSTLLDAPDAQFKRAVARALADLSNGDFRDKLVRDSLGVIQTLLAEHDDFVRVQLSRCLANLAATEAFQSRMLRHDLLGTLSALAAESALPAVQAQLARCVANLSSSAPLRVKLMEREWVTRLASWLDAPHAELRLACVVALANLAVNDVIASVMVEHASLLPSLLAAANSGGSAGSNLRLQQQVARAVSNLSAHEKLGPELFHKVGWVRFRALAEAGGVVTRRQAARTLANFAANDMLAYQLLGENAAGNGWPLLLSLASAEDVEVQRQAARAIANLAVNASSRLRVQPGLDAVLNRWINSDDTSIKLQAARAQASLASTVIQGPKYAEGIYLLHPVVEAPKSAGARGNAPVAAAAAGGPVAQPPVEFDIVFVHGVTGHPFQTWTIDSRAEAVESLTSSPDAALDQPLAHDAQPAKSTASPAKPTGPTRETCWPRDWLPSQYPRARVLSVGYDVSWSKWFGQALPLEQQSTELIKKLRLAGVGTRPVVFVAHSFGGLLVKEMLAFAALNDDFKPLLRNTRGIVFFSTPHRGAEIMKFVETYKIDVMLRGTSAVDELKPDSAHLQVLNENFPKIAPHVATLSFGENDKTCIGSNYTCFQLVTDESANPGFSGPHHQFVKLDFNHRMVCKPLSKTAVQYRMLCEFLDRTLGLSQRKA